MTGVKIVETKLNIFQAPQTHALAHPVESSFHARQGTLAWQFELIYGDMDELRKRPVTPGNLAVLEYNARLIYFLVIKAHNYAACSYEDVQAALICLREHMRTHELTKIAMPRLGCAEDDGLQWTQVKRIIQQVFAREYNVEFLICDYHELKIPTKCRIIEKEGNLLSDLEDYALVHSVSIDFALNSGLDMQFKCKFGQQQQQQQQQQRPHIGNVAVTEHAGGRYIYNLIARERTHEKSTYAALYYALLAMREHMRKNNVRKLILPRLACGIDRLDWLRVESLLELVFETDDVEIVTFFYEPPSVVHESIQITCPTCHHMRIVRMPSSRAASRLSLHREKTPF